MSRTARGKKSWETRRAREEAEERARESERARRQAAAKKAWETRRARELAEADRLRERRAERQERPGCFTGSALEREVRRMQEERPDWPAHAIRAWLRGKPWQSAFLRDLGLVEVWRARWRA